MAQLTLEMAKNLKRGQMLYHRKFRQGGGKIALRARVNGKPQVWVTRPNDVRVPMKHGLYNTFQLRQDTLGDWDTCPQEALNAHSLA